MAATLITPLLVTGAVAVVAYLTRSRRAFFCGLIVCWFAAVRAPEPIHAQYHSAEAAYEAHYNESVARSGRAVIGGIVGTAVGLILCEISAWRSSRRQVGNGEDRQ